MIKYFLMMGLTLFVLQAQANDVYPFKSRHQQQQFTRLTEELRCLVCQNENIADSNAKLAADLRQQVYEMVGHGQTDRQIKTYMVQRYGDFVLFKPPVVSRTYLLWYGPFGLLLLGFAILWFAIKKHRKQ